MQYTRLSFGILRAKFTQKQASCVVEFVYEDNESLLCLNLIFIAPMFKRLFASVF
jgi:hypothetical protein